jgi:hypothetical protein
MLKITNKIENPFIKYKKKRRRRRDIKDIDDNVVIQYYSKNNFKSE